MHTNFSNCGAEGWLAPTGACAAPAWARWPYLEPWVATIAFFVWLALYKTLECGGDIRQAIKAQLEGDEKHVRVAGVGYFIGIYLFKQVAKPAEIDWSCPSPSFLLLETAVVVCVVIKFNGAFVPNRPVDLHAIDATPARWRGEVGSSPLDGASAATSSPRNDLVKNYRCTRHTD
jgi:hypothetical protein